MAVLPEFSIQATAEYVVPRSIPTALVLDMGVLAREKTARPGE
jgi:hypothetical protein